MNDEDLKKRQNASKRRSELAKLDPINFAALQAVFHKWMLVPDPGIIKFLCAFYCANKLSRKALWAIIIGPSGGGKTELLNALLDLPDIEELSMVTTTTFLSGMPGKYDSSLLPRISGKILLFKDWTTILSMQKDARAEIFSQFREIWDGRMKKSFGNGKTAEWSGKVSVLAASTQAVDLNQQQYTHLGERFINYRVLMPDRKEVAMRSLTNDSNQEEMQREIRDAMYSFIKSIDLDNHTELPKIPNEFQKQLINLANFSTMARSGVIREFGMKKEVIFVPAAEMPTRIAQQLNALGAGLVMVNGGKFLEEDMEILYKAALDSIPQTNKIVITEMARADNQTTGEIATACGYPTDPIKTYLENLALLKVCRRVKDGGRADRWVLLPEFADLMRHYEGVEMLTDAERKERQDDASGKSDEAEEDFKNF